MRKRNTLQRRLGVLTILALIAPYCVLGYAHPQKNALEEQGRARPIPGSPRRLPARRTSAVRMSQSEPGTTALFAGTSDGLFVSKDGGQSWASLPVNLTSEEVFGLAVHPMAANTVLVGRRDGLWMTEDGGTLWTPLPGPTFAPYTPLSLAIAEAQPKVIYMATARQGVYRSTDGGRSWLGASEGLPEALSGDRVEEFRSLTVDPQNPEVAYVAHERHGVYRTTDGGASWHPFTRGLPAPAWRPAYAPQLAFDPDDTARLYLVYGQPLHSHLIRSRLYVTSDAGEWLPLEVSVPDNMPIVSMYVNRERQALHLWAARNVWELPLSEKTGSKR